MRKLLWKTKQQQASAHKEQTSDGKEKSEIITDSKIFIDSLYQESVFKKGTYNPSLFEINRSK
jgi:hypothetical protein